LQLLDGGRNDFNRAHLKKMVSENSTL
jgi:hypothetical protein